MGGTASAEEAYGIEKRLLDAHRAALEQLLEMNFDLVWYNLHLPDEFIHLHSDVLAGGVGQPLAGILSGLDRLVRLALERCDAVVVVSDHGFREYRGVLRVNTLLFRAGIVRRARSPEDVLTLAFEADRARAATARTKFVRGFVAGLAYRVVAGVPMLRRIARRVLSVVNKVLKILGKSLVVLPPADVDAIRSRAFMPVPGGPATPMFYVLVNDLSVVKDVVSLLREHGVGALRGDELQGPYARNDIIYVYPETYVPVPGSTRHDEAVEEKKVVHHHRYGVLACSANYFDMPGVVPNYCVAPLTLEMLGVPPDPYMDCPLTIGRRERANYRTTFVIAKKVYKLAIKS